MVQYKDIGDIGPMRDQELHHFLTGLQGEEKGLIIADQESTIYLNLLYLKSPSYLLMVWHLFEGIFLKYIYYDIYFLLFV